MIKPPPCEWKHARNFDLSKLHEKFVIPDFQRELSSKHASRTLEAIIQNDFFDNVVQCGKRRDGTYEVYNGQHRLAALWRAHTEFGLDRYDIVLQIFPIDMGRRVFYRNNLGKPLTMQNRTKTFDDKKHPFFNRLRDLLGHNVTHDKTSYANMMNALKYAKSQTPKPVEPHKIEQFLKEITRADIVLCKEYLLALQEVSPHVPHADLFRTAVFRALFRIGYENNFNQEKWVILIEASYKSKKLKEFWKQGPSSHDNIKYTYQYVVEEIAPAVKLGVKHLEAPEYTKSEKESVYLDKQDSDDFKGSAI